MFILMLALLLPTLTSCTNPDGDTHGLGGTWLFESIEVDGEQDAFYPSKSREVMISFQGKLFSMAGVDCPELIGSWERSGDVLTLDIHWGAGQIKDWPSQLGFGQEKVLTFKIVKPSSKRMEWALYGVDGPTRLYRLRKI